MARRRRTRLRGAGKLLELVRACGSVLYVAVTPLLVEDAGVRIGRIGAVVADNPEARSELMVTVAYDPLTAPARSKRPNSRFSP